MIDREQTGIIIGAVFIVLLQLVLSPNIVLGHAMPNFVLVYVVICAIVMPSRNSLVLAFVLGLVYNLVAGGPVGAMSFLLIMVVTLLASVFSVMDNDNALMPLIAMAVSSLFVELFYAVIMVLSQSSISFFEGLFYIAFPSALYDCVVGVIVYFLVKKFIVSSDKPTLGRSTL